ncbi:MAG: hypothetical protein MMC23_005793 [Stictis urceolatum]|nr:hypothetical protein [Stictis urceolata]
MIDSISETPLKRRKTENGRVTTSQRGYDSLDDSGEDLFGEETVDTVLLPPPREGNPEQNSTLASYPISYATQPTQLVEDTVPCSPLNRPAIQVAASSPVPASSPLAPPKQKILPQTMAPPAGTVFRMPPGAVKSHAVQGVIELSDDDDEGIRYVGGSSDDDTQRRSRDIKPSVLNARKGNTLPTRTALGASPTIDNKHSFSQIMAKSVYNPSNEKGRTSASLKGSLYDSRNRDDSHTTTRIQAPKRPAATMASAYGESARDPKKQRVQTGPAKAAPVVPDMAVSEIPDFGMRRKVENMSAVLGSQYTIRKLYATLVDKKADENDAMNCLTNEEPLPSEAEFPSNSIDLTVEDEDDGSSLSQISAKPKKPTAKQHLKAPVKSLRQKYAASQNVAAKPSPRGLDQEFIEKPKGRRLVKGRRRPSSPARRSSSPIAPPRAAIAIDSDDGEPDSAMASSEAETTADFKGTLLKFFNTCSPIDLADLASTTEDIADLVISQRPFRTLAQVRRIGNCNENTQPKKKGISKRVVGEKIVEVCEIMWAGYEAVDELVRQCEVLSQPVAQEMKKWGVDVYGGSNAGELDIVNLEEATSNGSKTPRDSGIGTPTSNPLSGEEDADGAIKAPTRSKLFQQPGIMSEDITLKDYQVVGVNWLSLLYRNNLSCILADDMGLGKTCQVIAFLAHLYEKGEQGPHLIIVPASVIENWMREFQTFCPTLSVFPYHGKQNERPELQAQIEKHPPNVIVTTYNLAKRPDDRKFLRLLKPIVCVYDEGHALKNRESQAYGQLMRIKCRFRLLLTGTPLQNNLGELASLLGFILPDVFSEHDDDLRAIFAHKATTQNHTHEALLSDQRVGKAKSILTPFILRRKKHQVLKHLPKKTKRTEYCEMTEWQKHVYNAEWERNQKSFRGRAKGDKTAEKAYNVQMALRKAAIHPMLHRYKYDDETCERMRDAYMKDSTATEANPDFVLEDLMVHNDFTMMRNCDEFSTLRRFKLDDEPWMDSGKVEKLVDLCLKYKENGDRVLIFSQMTQVMDVLEEVLNTVNVRFCRLDGNTNVEERQDLIDLFYEDTDTTAFMLSTKAGGAGINLACANKVIIFDSGYNPQDDIQAENRAHRVGQTREVEVVRLVTRGTIEEAIHALGETKLALDEKVAATEDDSVVSKKIEKSGMKQIEAILKEQMKGNI